MIEYQANLNPVYLANSRQVPCATARPTTFFVSMLNNPRCIRCLAHHSPSSLTLSSAVTCTPNQLDLHKHARTVYPRNTPGTYTRFSQPNHALSSTKSEFSPPLDTSLIAAIVADYVNDSSGDPSPDQLQSLRRILAELAAQAEQDEDPLVDDFAQLQLSGSDDTTSTTDLFSPDPSIHTANTSNASSLSQQSFSSPLGFLQAAFPHLPVSRLKSALGSAQDEDEVDMESIVNDIMSSELVKELEERGLEEEEVPEAEWETAQPAKKAKKRKGGKTFTLVDVRQRQHAQPATSSRPAAPDPWTQLSSVAAHLETLLPSHSASYFQSLFHSPNYSSPSDALRAALTSMSASSSSSSELRPDETQSLFSMFDLIRESPAYVSLTDVDREQMLDDAQLALRATQGNADTAIDLVWLLRELESGDVNWAVYHSPASPVTPFSTTASNMKSKHSVRLPNGPPAVQPPRLKNRAMTAPAAPTAPPPPPPNAWKTIPVAPKRGPNPHADFIPAYKSSTKPQISATLGKKAADGHEHRANELLAQQREALREASRAWQRGNSHSRGGEVAMYFAERVRLQN